MNHTRSHNNSFDATGTSKHVGILAMEVYTPRSFVRQSALEEYSGIAQGKYTIGLGQEALGITGDAEDINSLCLTVVHALLEKYEIDPNSVGRLEVGTETLVDKSKSTKTILMDLFPHNSDIEGATVVNACYGGTSALLNAFMWCESSGWDGRYAVVVAADIAAYARGPARPTSGAGAVAFLVGRDAPIAFVPHLRATHAKHTWDFFKPDHSVEYPTVNGKLSQVCYYQALEDCYERFCQKATADMVEGSEDKQAFDATSPDYWVFHSPYNKLVQKSYARLFLLDARRRYQQEQSSLEEKTKKAKVGDDEASEDPTSLLKEEWLLKSIEETYEDKALEKVLKQISANDYDLRLLDANSASCVVGNTYAASVFLGLASLVDRAGRRGDLTDGKSIVMFSYGSGSLATMYKFEVRKPTSQTKFTCQYISETMQLTERLALREEVHPCELDYALETRARMHSSGAPYNPIYPTIGRLFPGTYYLNGIDSEWRRSYSRVPLDAPSDTPKDGCQYLDLAPAVLRQVPSRE